jgi:hypothetical protein
MVFVGFMDGSKAIRYYDAKTWLIKISQNITFNENEEPRELEIIEVPGMQVEGEIRENTHQQPVIPPQKPIAKPQKPELRQLVQQTGFIDYTKVNPSAWLPTWQVPITTDTPNHADQTNLAEELFLGMTFLTTGSKEDLPWSYEEVINGPEADQWKEAMDAEMGQLKKMGTWQESELPEERKASVLRSGSVQFFPNLSLNRNRNQFTYIYKV